MKHVSANSTKTYTCDSLFPRLKNFEAENVILLILGFSPIFSTILSFSGNMIEAGIGNIFFWSHSISLNILIYFKCTKATSSIKTKSNGFWLPREINKWKVVVLFPLLSYGFVDNFWNFPFKFYFSDVES